MDTQMTPERFESYEKTREIRRHKLDNEGNYFFTLEGKSDLDSSYAIIKWFPDEHEKAELVSEYYGHLCYFHEESDIPQLPRGITFYTSWAAFEIIKGHSLMKEIRTRGPMDEEEALRLCDKVADALERASDFGMVHLSLNPANIFIVNGSVKIKDWVLKQEFLDIFSQIPETHDYYAPDLMDMQSADEHSDMHSLALVGAFMVTGEWAIKNHLAEEGRIPEGFRHRLDPLLDPNPDNRPATWKDARSLLTAKKLLTVPMVEAATVPKKKVPLFNVKGSATKQSNVGEAEKKREKIRFVKTEEAEKTKLKEPKTVKVKDTRVKERPKKEKIERKKDEAQKERINLRKVAIVAGAVVVAVMLAMLPLLASSLFKENPQNLLQAQPQYISAPSFVGLSSEEAEQLAADNGILIEKEEQFSNEVEAGKIMTQDPGQGAEVEEGFTVKLSVSKGPEIVEEAPAEVATNTTTPDQQTGSGTTNTGGGGGTAPPATPASGSPPVAAFTYSPASGPSSGVIVKCNASGSYDPDGGPLSYSWSFGGSGVSASGEFVSSIAPVDKAITLTVTDSEGKKSSVTHYVHLY